MKEVTRLEQWLKLLAYVLVTVADCFVEDLKTFHGLNIMGTPFWLKKPEEGVYSAPLCFPLERKLRRRLAVRVYGLVESE